jgi:hypothetical protein
METILEKQPISFGSWYTHKRLSSNKIAITGYDPTQKIDVGSKLHINSEPPQTYAVVDIKRRDHAGTFIDKALSINSHYSATLQKLEY